MEASSVLAFSTLKTGVLPRLTTWVGPLTGAAGLDRYANDDGDFVLVCFRQF